MPYHVHVCVLSAACSHFLSCRPLDVGRSQCTSNALNSFGLADWDNSLQTGEDKGNINSSINSSSTNSEKFELTSYQIISFNYTAEISRFQHKMLCNPSLAASPHFVISVLVSDTI